MLDTKGPEIRTGEIKNEFTLKENDTFILTIEKVSFEETNKINVNYNEFINDINEGDIIIIDSGVLKAKAIKKENKDIHFKVIEGKGIISSKRHINLMGKRVSLPTITEEDWKDINFGIKENVDFIALSFVRNSKDIIKLREYLKEKNSKIKIISKIENYESTLNIEEIIKESDGIMYARGDLSCEISYGKVPYLQKKIRNLCSYYNKPLIIATQMLYSMIKNIQPTRAEVNDVGNAVMQRVDCVMTSDETTKSNHPVFVIDVMNKIILETEEEIYHFNSDFFNMFNQRNNQRYGFDNKAYFKNDYYYFNTCDNNNINDNNDNFKFERNLNIISILPFITKDIEAIVIIENYNDYFVNNISASRLNIPMIAFTNNEILFRQMNILWNISPVYNKNISDDYISNINIIEKILYENNIKKYLLVFNMIMNNNNIPTIQIKTIK